MAHKKAGGSSRNGRDSEGKRLGLKVSDGETVRAGGILVTQRGTPYKPGLNVSVGRTHSLHAEVDGVARYQRKAGRVNVSVEPALVAAGALRDMARGERQPGARGVWRAAFDANARRRRALDLSSFRDVDVTGPHGIVDRYGNVRTWDKRRPDVGYGATRPTLVPRDSDLLPVDIEPGKMPDPSNPPAWQELKDAWKVMLEALNVDERSLPAKREAISSLLRSAFRAGRRAEVVRTVMPSLYQDLFSHSQEIGWAAAYAIASIRGDGRLDSGRIPDRSPDLERIVLNEIQAMLTARAPVFSQLHVEQVQRANGVASVHLRVDVSNGPPLQLLGRRPHGPRPEWLGTEPELEVIVTDARARILARQTDRAPSNDDFLARLQMNVKVNTREVKELFVDPWLDKRPLGRHRVTINEPLAAR